MTELAVMSTPADEDSFMSAVDEVKWGLDNLYEEDGNTLGVEPSAYLYAAGRSMGMSPDDAKWMVCGPAEAPEEFWTAVKDKAADIIGPWGWLQNHAADEDVAMLKRILRRYQGTGVAESAAAEFDLEDGLPREPDWILRGQIAAGRCTMASADQSASKTTWAVAVMHAVVRGGRVLDREAKPGRVLYVTNEEDRDQFKEEKLKPLGFTNADLDQMQVHTRGTFPLLGSEEGNAWIVATVEAGDFDLVVLDTTSSVVSTDSNSNDAVNALFTDVLDPLIDRTGAALLYLHHERKSGGTGDRSQAARGARAWSDRANFHVTFATVSKYAETATGEGERVTTARKFVQRRPKARGGGVDKPVQYELRGEKDRPDGATLSLALELPHVEYTDAEQIAAACDGETTRKALADALGWNATGDRFTKALDTALDEKLIRRVERGVYAPGEVTE